MKTVAVARTLFFFSCCSYCLPYLWCCIGQQRLLEKWLGIVSLWGICGNWCLVVQCKNLAFCFCVVGLLCVCFPRGDVIYGWHKFVRWTQYHNKFFLYGLERADFHRYCLRALMDQVVSRLRMILNITWMLAFHAAACWLFLAYWLMR